MTVAGILKESAHYFLHIAHYLWGFHESADGLVQKRIIGRPGQLRIVRPLRENCLHEFHNRRALFSWREVARINIEDEVLEEVFELDFFVIGEEGDQVGNERRIKDDSFNEVDDAMMIIFEESAELWHLHEVYFLLLDFSLKAETVFEGTELLDKLNSLLIVLSNAG